MYLTAVTFTGKTFCTVINNIKTVFLITSLTLVYIVLWLRQRKFNTNLPMKLEWWNNFHIFCSYFVLMLISISCAACLVIFLGLFRLTFIDNETS